jgi:hypothetical protein
MYHTSVDNNFEHIVSSEWFGYPVSMSDQNEEYRESQRLGDDWMNWDEVDNWGMMEEIHTASDSDDHSYPVDANPSADRCLADCYMHANDPNVVHRPPQVIKTYYFTQGPSDETGTRGDSDEDSHSAILECPTAGSLVGDLRVDSDVFVHNDPSHGGRADHPARVVDLNIGEWYVTVKWYADDSLGYVDPQYLVHQDSVVNTPRRSSGSPNRTGRKRPQSS